MADSDAGTLRHSSIESIGGTPAPPMNNQMLSTQQFHEAFVGVKGPAGRGRKLLLNSDRTVSLEMTRTPEQVNKKFAMYRLEGAAGGGTIDQKNTLLSLFSKPGDATASAADNQALMTQRRVG